MRIHIKHFQIFNDGKCTEVWIWIHSRNFSLVTTVNRFVNDRPNFQFSALEIALANILRDVLVLLDVADVHQCSKVDFPYFCFCVPSSWPPFIPFPLSPLYLESILLEMKDLLFLLLGFQRHASLRDRSPESSEPYVTLDSRSSLNRTTFGVHTSFFPSSHLRVSCTPRILRFTGRIFISQIRCAARRDNMCLLSPSEKVRWRAFLRSFHRNEFLRKVVIRYRTPSFPAISIQLNWFCLRCFGFSPNPPPSQFISSRKSFVQ